MHGRCRAGPAHRFCARHPLIYIQRVHCINGAAQIFNHNFFRASCTPGLTPEIAAGSIYRYLENTLGMSIVTSKRTITVEKATALDRAWIDLGSMTAWRL